jgi:hypothetical protein
MDIYQLDYILHEPEESDCLRWQDHGNPTAIVGSKYQYGLSRAVRREC